MGLNVEVIQVTKVRNEHYWMDTFAVSGTAHSLIERHLAIGNPLTAG